MCRRRRDGTVDLVCSHLPVGLPHGHSSRYDWQFMKALCVPCHVTVHQHLKLVFTPRQRGI